MRFQVKVVRANTVLASVGVDAESYPKAIDAARQELSEQPVFADLFARSNDQGQAYGFVVREIA